MKKRILCITLLFVLTLTACTERVSPLLSDGTKPQQEISREETSLPSEGEPEGPQENPSEPEPVEVPSSGKGVDDEHKKEEAVRINVTIGEQTFTADLTDNSSADALVELLKNGTITIDMHDYGNFEKVGAIGQTLPRNDERITTGPGDIILYQDNQLVLYYATNTWEFTSIGHIPNVTTEELLAVLGEGDVTVQFSLNEE